MLTKWKGVLVISGLAAMLIMPTQAQDTPRAFAVDTRTPEQKREDQRRKAAELIVTLENTPIDQKPKVTQILLDLGRLQFDPAAPYLLKYFKFEGVLTNSLIMRSHRIIEATELVGKPAPRALLSLSNQALPVIIDGIAGKFPDLVENKDTLQRAWLSVAPRFEGNRNKFISTLQGYSDQYRSQANRLRRLTAEVPNLPDLPPEAQKTYTPLTDIKEQTTRLERIFELEDVLTNPDLTENEQDGGNSKVVLAMNELTKVHAVEALSLIVDKLDDHKNPPQEDDKFIPPIMAADPQGLLSTNIAEATPSMIRRFGDDALPALIKAISMSRRTPKFQSTALQLLTERAGGPINAKALMNKAADEDDAKAQRLRDWVVELVKLG